MAIEIVVLEKGGSLLARFRIETGAPVEDGDWHLVRNLAEQGRLLEIFFCYAGTEALHCDRKLLEKLVAQANFWAAGARVLPVIEQGIFERFDLDWAKDSLEIWFHSASEREVNDILECCLSPLDHDLLRYASDRSYEREEVWKAALQRDDWVAVWSNPRSRLARFVEPYLSSPAKSRTCCYLLLVEENDPETQRSVVETWLDDHTADQTIVATVSFEHKGPMKELCSAHGLKQLRLRGPFELRYLLIQLNRGRGGDEASSR